MPLSLDVVEQQGQAAALEWHLSWLPEHVRCKQCKGLWLIVHRFFRFPGIVPTNLPLLGGHYRTRTTACRKTKELPISTTCARNKIAAD